MAGRSGSGAKRHRLVMLERDEATPERIVRALRSHGCCVARNLVTPRVMGRVKKELDPWLERTPTGEGEFIGRFTKRVGGLVARSPSVGEKLAMHPTILAVMDAMLLGRCHHYHLSPTQCVSIGPDETPQPLHRDDAIYPFRHPGEPSVITVIWAVSDFTAENGATQTVPGSHLWDDERLPRPGDKVVQAEMPSGSAIIYDGALYHGGAPNFTDRWRTGIILGYALGWLRQEENQYLACPPEVARTLSPGLQKLIGYQLHAPFLGWYEMQDPIYALRSGDGSMPGAGELLDDSAGESALNLGSSIKRV
ncbi:MAG: phytanoyl-CoA dioxygenase family protein [Proteobacteria bacterium]|nr:phytanoyl-CoA dioxygenase family protein [Pseudomonadota bacterium]